MKLTTELLSSFVGGQMEIQNEREEYLYRGEVETIVVVNNELRVKLTWLAKGEGFPPIPKKWIKCDRLEYAASLQMYSANNIGPSSAEVGGGDRLCLNSDTIGETVIFYPSDGSKLDPKKVEGLVLKRVFTKGEILLLWPQSAGELRGFQRALEAKSGITAAQLGMAVQLAEAEFQRLKEQDVDWTIDPATGNSNSSPEFLQLCGGVDELIKDSVTQKTNQIAIHNMKRLLWVIQTRSSRDYCEKRLM